MEKDAATRLARHLRIRQAILDGLAFARTKMHNPSDTDIAICIEVELRNAGIRLSVEKREDK